MLSTRVECHWVPVLSEYPAQALSMSRERKQVRNEVSSYSAAAKATSEDFLLDVVSFEGELLGGTVIRRVERHLRILGVLIA
jgi:hypothetical protein